MRKTGGSPPTNHNDHTYLQIDMAVLNFTPKGRKAVIACWSRQLMLPQLLKAGFFLQFVIFGHIWSPECFAKDRTEKKSQE